MTYQVDLEKISGFLTHCLTRRLDARACQWLKTIIEKIKDNDTRLFFMSYSSVVRYTGKEYINLDENEIKAGKDLRNGWMPDNLSLDQATRLFLLLNLPHKDYESYRDILDKLVNSADLMELVSVYQCFPLLPYPDKLVDLAQDGSRSNMDPVFNAIALDNPYPGDFFTDEMFNNMVLKALFIGSPLYKIVNLNNRLNKELSRMALDFVNERQAANRTVSPEVWHLIGPFSDMDTYNRYLNTILTHDDVFIRKAGALACLQSPVLKDLLLTDRPDLAKEITEGGLDWEEYGRQLYEKE